MLREVARILSWDQDQCVTAANATEMCGFECLPMAFGN